MEWCKPEKRRLDNSEDPSLLQGGEKRILGGFCRSGADGMNSIGHDSSRHQPNSLSLFNSNGTQIPATHFTPLNQSTGVSSYAAMPHDLLVRQVTQAAGQSFNADDCSMDVVEARTGDGAEVPLTLVPSCSSSSTSSTTQSPMLSGPALAGFGQRPRSSATAPCPRCLAGEGGHFKHVISERHEHHPWYF